MSSGRFKNYYKVLEIELFASVEDIKSAFRRLARIHHPDVNQGNAEKFKEINEAYDVLGNQQKKAVYDESLKALYEKSKIKESVQSPSPKPNTSAPNTTTASPKKKPPPKSQQKPSQPKTNSSRKPDESTSSINDMFETFLKKGFGGFDKKENDNSFETKSTASSGQQKNGSAGGPSRQSSSSSQRTTQSASRPKSETPSRGQDVTVEAGLTPEEASGGVVKTVNVQHNEICKRCSGSGKLSGSPCSSCDGEGVLIRLKKIDVRIPAGVKEGSKVRVASEGGQGRFGGESGDLFLQIRVNIDDSLRVEGMDVHSEVSIASHRAVLGTEVTIQTMNGPLKMTIPAGTSSGKVLRLKEQGVRSDRASGDHFVTVQIESPKNLSEREKELYQELARLRPDKSE